MIDSLPGLETGLMAMATMGLGSIGILVHLAIAAFRREDRGRVASMALGALGCCIVGLVASEIGARLDDHATLIPVVGVVLWIAISVSLAMLGRTPRRAG